MGETRPPTADRLMRKATAYLARRSASTARMREVLARAIMRAMGDGDRLEAGAVAALVDPVVERLERAGLLDDAAFARMKAKRLAEKGKPSGAIRADLKYRYGVEVADAGLEASLAALDPAAQAARWAARRRLGPFRSRDRERKREADIASLVRAGFPVGIAKAVIDGCGETDAPVP